MNKVAIFLFFMYSMFPVKAQIDCMQGTWADIYNGENEYNEFSFTVITGHNSLNFVYTEDRYELDFPLTESIIGFLDYNPKTTKSYLNINKLNDNGKFYIVFDTDYIKDGQIKNSFIVVPEYFECEGENMSINGGQLIELIKIERLPSFALKLLYNRGKKDDKDYIEKYLDIKVKEIQVDKSIIYSEPGTATKMFLIKGDVATVLEEKGEWLKIEFLGKRLVTGWIKKEDAN